MDNKSGNKPPEPSSGKSALLQAILAVLLAVAAQSAARDGLVWLGLAGFVIAALLFVTSVGAIFKASTLGEPMPAEAGAKPSEAEVEPVTTIDGTSKLRYLQRHWRLVTVAEILSGDIPPTRVGIPEADELGDDPTVVGAAGVTAVAQVDTPVTDATDSQTFAEMPGGTATASPTPKAVKVITGGDVLVLDTSQEQLQRFDEQGSLLATYSLPELAGIEVLDLDVSPDGKTLYVVDAGSRLRVISLGNEESKGGSETG